MGTILWKAKCRNHAPDHVIQTWLSKQPINILQHSKQPVMLNSASKLDTIQIGYHSSDHHNLF